MYRSNVFDGGGAEIAAYDSDSTRAFVVNLADRTIDILDLSDPSAPSLVTTIDVAPWGNSYGQPDSVDPEGSISLIDLRNGIGELTQSDVTELGFTAFNDRSLLDPSIRVYGPGATVAQDLEPEYIAVSHDSRTAWVTLQENNALAILDLPNKRVESLVGLGFKDHSVAANGFDSSDRDGHTIAIAARPVLGMFNGNTDADAEREQLYSFGAGSFAVWDAAGQLRYDSGSLLERLIAARNPEYFNANHTNNTNDQPNPNDWTHDSRSDDKGPEPNSPAAEDLGPEGVIVVPGDDSPIGVPLLIVANEVSGTTRIFEIAMK